jgi:iron complex outermembrane recepter protein
MKDRSFQRMTVGAAVAAILGTAAMSTYSPVVRSANAPAQAQEIEEVTVTGSRISRPDIESNSPLVVVGAEQLESRTGLNVESFLNQLPNFNPAASPVTTQQDVQITPVNSVGVASISLRGFGPNRNLVLVNGHRMVPINALMVTDINSVPSALIERVEIISGGASAVYGADAIGGVTNFILKDNFEGMEVDLQYGIAEVGDSEEVRAYTVMGTNFADNRGNVTVGFEYYNREPAYERNRDFYTDAWADPTVGGDFFVFGYNGYNSARFVNPAAFDFRPNAPSVPTLQAIFRDRPIYGATGPTGQANPGAGLQTGVRTVGATGFFEGFRFNNDGTVFATGTGNNLYKWRQGGGAPDGQEYAYQWAYDGTLVNGTGQQVFGQVVETLKWNYTDAYASAPQDRYSIYGSGHYDITDNVQFYASGMWAQSKTSTRLFPANASFGWEATIPYNRTTDSPLRSDLNYNDAAVVSAALADPTNPLYANPSFIPTGRADPDGAGPGLGSQHPVTPEFAAVLNSRPDPAAGWILETYPINSFDARATENTNEAWQVDAGLKFDMPFGDWTGDVYISHGESATYNRAYGNNSLTRWRLMVTQNDYGRNANLEANQANTSPSISPPASAGFGGAQVSCTSGFYDMIFAGDTRPSENCRVAVQANLQTRAHNTQDIGSVNFQGGLFEMWAGEVRAAAGVEYRQNSATFTPDILQSTSSFADQVVGVYPTGYLDAETSVIDYYGELLVPIMSDLPFAQRVELELGGRYSDYEDTDSTFTYKITGNWQFNDWLRLRGGYNRATRAPNLGEMFLNVQEIFTVGGNFGDPCGLRSNAPYGAGGAANDPVLTGTETNPPPLAAGQTAEGAQSAYLICQAMMGTTGSAQFYSQNQAAPGPGGGFAWVLQQGNPDLDSEVADTWTAGLVFTSASANPWLSRFTASVDWWKVDISDAIQQYSTDYASYRCFGETLVASATEAQAQAATRACQNVARNQSSGAQVTTLLEYDNQATIETSGIDASVNWFAQFEEIGLSAVPGGLGVNVTVGWTDYYRTKQSPLPIDVETDWVGSLGPNLSGTNPGAYRYRLITSVNYSVNTFNVSLRWRNLPSVWGANKASENAIIANNESVAAGGEGILLSYTPTTAIKTEGYNAFDLSANWDVNDRISIRAGIDNLFDTQPNTTGATAGRPYDPSLTLQQNRDALNAVCQGAPGCVNPTTWSLPSSGAGITNGGFYDTIGRRYFLGVKARL